MDKIIKMVAKIVNNYISGKLGKFHLCRDVVSERAGDSVNSSSRVENGLHKFITRAQEVC